MSAEQPARRRGWSVLRSISRQGRTREQGPEHGAEPMVTTVAVGEDGLEVTDGPGRLRRLRSGRAALTRRLSRLWMSPGEGRVRQSQRRAAAPSMAQVEAEAGKQTEQPPAGQAEQ